MQKNSTSDNLEPGNIAPGKIQRQLTLDLGHTPSLADVDFIVSDSNQLAFEHIMSFPNWPTPLMVLMGPPKSGKSHLAQIWTERSGAHIATNDMLTTLATDGGVDPVLIEDVDSGDFEETAMFHMLNQSMRDERPLLLTARLPVLQWPFTTDDVLSRARRGTSFTVDVPDDIQLSQMFAKLFDDRQIAVDPKIVTYLVSRMERSTEEAVNLVALMDEIALARRIPITRSVASEALALRHDAFQRSIGDNNENERDN